MASRTTRVINMFKTPKSEQKTEIATDMYIPNHSGIASHPEATGTFVKKAGDTMTGRLNVNQTSTEDNEPAVNLTHTGEEESTLWVSGNTPNSGVVKITHNKPTGSDANAAALSIDVAGSGTAARGIFVDSTDTTTGDLLNLRNNGTEKVVVDDEGNVGIGTGNPQRNLHIKDDALGTQTLIALENTNTTDNSGVTISWRGTTDGVGGTDFVEFGAMDVKFTEHDNATATSEMGFWTMDSGTLTNQVTIKDNGFVGIGTTTPGNILPKNWFSATGSDRNRVLDLTTTDDDDVGVLLRTNSAGTLGGSLWYDNSGGTLRIDNRFDNDIGDIRFRTKTAGTAVDALTIDGSGNVGIGTTSPVVELHVKSTQPDLRLEDSDGGYSQITSNAGGLLFQADPANSQGSTTIQYRVDGSEVARFTSSGRLGIATTSPDTTLQVVGDTKFGDDNTNYVETSSTGDMKFVGGAGLPFANIYANDVELEHTISGSGQANKVQITAFNADGPSNNMTPDHTNDHITVDVAGHYLCTVSITAESVAGVGAEFGFAVYKNNGATEFANLHAHRDIAGGGGAAGSISLSGIIDCAASDTIEVWVWNESNTQNIIIDDISLSLTQVGGT